MGVGRAPAAPALAGRRAHEPDAGDGIDSSAATVAAAASQRAPTEEDHGQASVGLEPRGEPGLDATGRVVGSRASPRATAAFSNASSPSAASTAIDVAGPELALEQLQRELVDELLLDHPLERARAVGRVVAEVAEQRPRVVGQLDLDAALAHTLDQPLDLQVDDLADLLARERVELDDLVEPVDELGLEGGLDAGDAARDVRGHDHDRVLEVDGAALAVGQAAVVHHLQQHVEDVGVRLLDLVEQHDRVRAAPHGLGQLAALLVADVAGRRADEPRHRVLLHVLGHVDADHRLLGVEHELGERPGQLGLADAGRAEEQERADRAVRVLKAGARAPQRVRDRRRPPRPGRSRARAAAPPCG